MEVVTDFIHKCCTTEENVDALVIRAAKSLTKQGTTIINILGFQTNVMVNNSVPPLLTPAELVQILDRTDVMGAELTTMLSDCRDLQDLL